MHGKSGECTEQVTQAGWGHAYNKEGWHLKYDIKGDAHDLLLEAAHFLLLLKALLGCLYAS